MDAFDLDDDSYLSLATFRRSGVVVPTPVWFAREGDRLYVFSEGEAGKVKRLRNDSRIRIARCDVRGRTRGEWFDGTGRLVDDESTVDAAYRVLRSKYGWQMRVVDFFSTLTGRIHKRAILELELNSAS
ncbi:PPOX class F420-dependent oxidoreductase [Myxococcota bacterium]|nr:PPOX class F420-dependent oxidoreductase [Myxococcota bacterium]